MNKTQTKKAINKAVYAYINEKYPDWDIDHSEGYGRVYFVNSKNNNDLIEYSQSEHSFCLYNWADNSIKEIVKDLENFVREVKSLNVYLNK